MSQDKYFNGPTILVAPLDWGLGHATRCIPLIKALLQQQCRVIIAGEGKVKQLLQHEFPDVEFLHLRGYRVRYASKKWLLPLRLALQLPYLLSILKKEQLWLEKVCAAYKIDAVISDNRYGLYHPIIPSVFITHQLRIQTFLGEQVNNWLQQLHYRYIRRFSVCWVPDAAVGGLAGALSHPPQLPPIPVHYLGPLSRFIAPAQKPAPRHLLVLLSGPEPQRSVLEQLLLSQVQQYKGKVVWVRGLPDATDTPPMPAHVESYNHLPAAELKTKLLEARFVIARSGYSTVMDIAVLQQKAIYIPTPGQTEQEYLAKVLMQQNRALSVPQHKFQLLPALSLAAHFTYAPHPVYEAALDAVLQPWLAQLRKKLRH